MMNYTINDYIADIDETENDKYLLSVLMPVYNHGKFLKQALESVLAQNTNFKYKILVCDDFSDDNSRDIIDSYAERYDNIVKLYQPCNSRGANNLIEGFKNVDTRYMAMCEGDDYWIDPHKLQKQVNFLEENPHFNICAHRVKIVYEANAPHTAGEYVYKNLNSQLIRTREGVFTAEEAINNYYFHTSSLVFRWKFKHGLAPWFAKRMCWDHFIFLLHAHDSWIKYFDETMSCWRHHASGWTFLQNIDKNLFFMLKHRMWDQVYKNMDKFYKYKYRKQINERLILSLLNTLEYCLKNNEIDKMRAVIHSNRVLAQKHIKNNEIVQKSFNIIFPDNRIFNLPWTSKPKTLAGEKQIGGYKALPMDLLQMQQEGSVWDSWVGESEAACFASVNQAIMRWLWEMRAERVWLPNYYEPQMDHLRSEAQIWPIYYECGFDLRPSPALVQDMMPGDAVITCAWFGAPAPADFQKALSEKAGIHWLEDRRHALQITSESKAPYVAYSAPELLGLPDGGILVGKGCAEMAQDLPCEPEQVLLGSLKYRVAAFEQGYSDLDQRLGLSREEERAFMPDAACSAFSIKMLKGIKIAPLVEKARANFAILYEAFASMSFLKDIDGYVPFAFPAYFSNHLFPHVTVDIAQSILAQANIICFRKWNPLKIEDSLIFTPSGAQRLSQSLLCIPCDWRYDKSDMERVINTINNEFVKFECNFQ